MTVNESETLPSLSLIHICPMIIGVNEDETWLASDVPAILSYCRSVYYIGNLEMARLSPGKAEFLNIDGDVIEKPLTQITWDAEAAEKGGYEHFMMKAVSYTHLDVYKRQELY